MTHSTAGTLIAGAVLLTTGSCASMLPRTDDRPAPSGRPSLGWLEHRGERHEIRNLMDPAYRAASDSDFARQFEPDFMIAGRESGLIMILPSAAPTAERESR